MAGPRGGSEGVHGHDQPFDGVWLPQGIGIHGTLALANGSYRVEYVREFFNYKQAEVAARIRGYRSPEEQSPWALGIGEWAEEGE